MTEQEKFFSLLNQAKAAWFPVYGFEKAVANEKKEDFLKMNHQYKQVVTEQQMENLRRQYPEVARAEAYFWEMAAKRAIGIIAPNNPQPRPSPLQEVAVEEDDYKQKTLDDIGNYISSRHGRKFLVNGSPRTPADGEDEASTIETA